MMVLGTASYPLSGNVARAHGRGPVGLRQGFFFFLMPLKFMSALSKNNYVFYFVILSI
jgi:hypothetical protein